MCLSQQITVLCHACSVLILSTACKRDCCCFFPPIRPNCLAIPQVVRPAEQLFATSVTTRPSRCVVCVALYNAARCTRRDEQSLWLHVALLGAVGGKFGSEEGGKMKMEIDEVNVYPCNHALGSRVEAPSTFPPLPFYRVYLTLGVEGFQHIQCGLSVK